MGQAVAVSSGRSLNHTAFVSKQNTHSVAISRCRPREQCHEGELPNVLVKSKAGSPPPRRGGSALSILAEYEKTLLGRLRWRGWARVDTRCASRNYGSGTASCCRCRIQHI
jgi:hypothetical protein